MRFFGLLMICGAMFAFFSAWKGVNEALPQLIADESLRDAVTRCVADAGTMLTIGICVIGLAVWCLAESQSRQLKKQAEKSDELSRNRVDRKEMELRERIRTEVYWLDKRIVELEAKLAGQSAPPSPPPPTT